MDRIAAKPIRDPFALSLQYAESVERDRDWNGLLIAEGAMR